MDAEDFQDYSQDGKLDEARYLQDMSQVFNNILSAQSQTGAKKAVWFPFGMGAFLRNLSKNDPSYTKDKMGQLKFKLAKAFLKKPRNFRKWKSTSVFLASRIQMQSRMHQKSKRIKIVMPFISPAKTPEIQDRVHLYINSDATQVAQDLANQAENSSEVSLVNGANRNLIGNHWFEDRALVAIDENIHRRSLLAAVMAYGFNGGTKVTEHAPNHLANVVSEKGGKVL
ncbi:MAG: hypothetical protein HWD61_15125 [Parachlamydiaceae bacterium]|nr:MAG: hypothetical protein HWD61_15125 [Parachlamydiaceae bacterium]